MRLKSIVIPLLIMAAGIVLSTCKKSEKEAPTIPVSDPIIRLVYFYSGSYHGDPASMPNPHLIKQATSADGINFGDDKTIFSYDNLVDPDIFKIGPGQYGLMGTDFGKMKSVLATSSTIDGTFTTKGEIDKVPFTQTATIRYKGVLKSFSSGIFISDLNITDQTASNSKLSVSTDHVNASKGIVADPSIAKMADGNYIMVFKYAPVGSGPDTHQVWMITSSDPASFTGKARLLRDKASVPCVVRAGSKLYIYFIDAEDKKLKISVGISSDNGATWTYSGTTLNGQSFTTGVDPAALPVDESDLE